MEYELLITTKEGEIFIDVVFADSFKEAKQIIRDNWDYNDGTIKSIERN